MPTSSEGSRKPNRRRSKNRSGAGVEGDRSASTDEARPEKPGNSVEEKTSRTVRAKAYEVVVDGEPAIYDGHHTSEAIDGVGRHRLKTGSFRRSSAEGCGKMLDERRVIAAQANRRSVVIVGPGNVTGVMDTRDLVAETPTRGAREGHQRPGPTTEEVGHSPIIAGGKESCPG